MDRNSVIGLVLIGAVMVGYSVWMSPSDVEIAKRKREQDSIAAIDASRIPVETAAKPVIPEAKVDTVIIAVTTAGDTLNPDSVKQIKLREEFGALAGAAEGKAEFFYLENEKLKLKISKKGGHIASAQLKEYRTYDSLPLMLFNEDSSVFSLNFFVGNKSLSTKDLYFEPVGSPINVSGKDSSSFTMRLKAEEGKYIDFIYGLQGNSYMVNFDISYVGMTEVFAPNTRDINLFWQNKLPRQEKSLESERTNSTVYFKYLEDEVDYISETKNEKIELEARTKWVAFKQQFFSSILIADNAFDKYNADMETVISEDSNSVKTLTSNLSIPVKDNSTFGMSFYLGPNHYQTLHSYDMELQRLIPLGWGIFGWVNRFFVIPIFNFLGEFNLSYGIIILLLTLFLKTCLFPFTYKAYLSTAKMKVLKPEIDELNKKFGTDDPLKKQQATMALYKKAGVSPFGGCLPMLLQMPILFAMFKFFPASIELRQEPFLWAEDLSSYDSVYDFGFTIPFYGDHVSLFCLLMTASTILYTRTTNQMNTSPEMAQMKWITYLMPIIFLGVLNNASAGLSYYYFLANMITFGQQALMKRFIDENALRAKIEEFKKKPQLNKKSGFQQRLEDAAKKRGYKMP